MVDVVATRLDGRAEGRIVRSVVRVHPTVVGIFHYGSRHNYVKPIDSKITQEIVIPHGWRILRQRKAEADTDETERRDKKSVDRVLGDEAARHSELDDLEGIVVDVEITDWPTPTQNPRGRVFEILGRQDDFGVDVEITIRKFHLPTSLSLPPRSKRRRMCRLQSRRRNSATAATSALSPSSPSMAKPPAISMTPSPSADLDNGNFELQVHIADVAQYVTPGSALDQEAHLRGTSVYFPDRAVPMLPLELSTDICSLRPHLDRLVLSCVMQIDPRGEIAELRIVRRRHPFRRAHDLHRR